MIWARFRVDFEILEHFCSEQMKRCPLADVIALKFEETDGNLFSFSFGRGDRPEG